VIIKKYPKGKGEKDAKISYGLKDMFTEADKGE
jgi:hypothetical protein